MNHTTMGIDLTEEAILNDEVSDATLETAAGKKAQAGAYTVPSSIICIPLGPQSAGTELNL
jgi:hypothetical protein